MQYQDTLYHSVMKLACLITLTNSRGYMLPMIMGCYDELSMKLKQSTFWQEYLQIYLSRVVKFTNRIHTINQIM